MGTYFTTTTKTSSTSHSLNNRRQNAEGSRSRQAHEAQHRAGRHRREEGGVPRRVHQAAVGLHQEAQPAGPREQAVLHPRQEDGKGVRRRPHPRLRHGQVPLSPPLLISLSSFPKNQMKRNFTRPDFSFSLCTNDIQHSCPIRPTIDSPSLPSSNSLSLGDAQPEDRSWRRSLFQGCATNRNRDWPFLGEETLEIPYVIEMSSSFEVLPRLIKIAKK